MSSLQDNPLQWMRSQMPCPILASIDGDDGGFGLEHAGDGRKCWRHDLTGFSLHDGEYRLWTDGWRCQVFLRWRLNEWKLE